MCHDLRVAALVIPIDRTDGDHGVRPHSEVIHLSTLSYFEAKEKGEDHLGLPPFKLMR